MMTKIDLTWRLAGDALDYARELARDLGEGWDASPEPVLPWAEYWDAWRSDTQASIDEGSVTAPIDWDSEMTEARNEWEDLTFEEFARPVRRLTGELLIRLCTPDGGSVVVWATARPKKNVLSRKDIGVAVQEAHREALRYLAK